MFTSPPPLSLYIHLPWCVRKCPYCDFNSHTAKETLPEELYVKALLKDLDEQLPFLSKRPLISIFFGGGTPSLFSAKSIENILLGVQQRFSFHREIEITLEANPGTLDTSRFKGFYDTGINRISLGIQSFQDEKLKALGRIHDREAALRAIDALHQVGFKNFNLDLMHGLPNQSLDDALDDLKNAFAWKPPHLSWYQLTLEPNTLFHHRPPTLPSEEILWDIQKKGEKLIAQQGLQQYEISAYSLTGYQCAHNLNYWTFGDYLGIGAGAHSKITDHETSQVMRHWQVKNPKDYLNVNKPFTAERKRIAEKELIFEFMLNALRLIEGVPASLFTDRTGLPIQAIQRECSIAREKGLLTSDENRLQPTKKGLQFLNSLLEIFMTF